nr:MAG TPA: cytochrome C6 [Microviridae sp.]
MHNAFCATCYTFNNSTIFQRFFQHIILYKNNLSTL